jgi:hypothetical protein
MAKRIESPQTSPNGLVPIEFTKRWKMYHPGEIAGFSPEISAGHVKNGSAFYVEAEKPEAAKK